jgi:hypothetical protein
MFPVPPPWKRQTVPGSIEEIFQTLCQQIRNRVIYNMLGKKTSLQTNLNLLETQKRVLGYSIIYNSWSIMAFFLPQAFQI